MKLMKRFLAIAAMFAAVVSVLTMSACSDNDDVPPSAKELEGSYIGTVKYPVPAAAPSSKATNTPPVVSQPVEFKIVEGKIVFDAFPYEPIVTMVVGEVTAPGIIAAIGKLKYDFTYNATYAGKQTFKIAITPGDLKINAANVVVEITTSPAAAYTYNVDTKAMSFSLLVKSVTVGGTQIPTLAGIPVIFEATRK